MDYVTGAVALLISYLIPICFVAWFAGRGHRYRRGTRLRRSLVHREMFGAGDGGEPGQAHWSFLMRFGMFGVSAILTAEVAEGKRIEEALRRAHRSLEARVAERTLELARTNAMLQAEVAERTRPKPT